MRLVNVAQWRPHIINTMEICSWYTCSEKMVHLVHTGYTSSAASHASLTTQITNNALHMSTCFSVSTHTQTCKKGLTDAEPGRAIARAHVRALYLFVYMSCVISRGQREPRHVDWTQSVKTSKTQWIKFTWRNEKTINAQIKINKNISTKKCTVSSTELAF